MSFLEKNSFWKYAILATGVQFIACMAIWISTLVVSLSGEPLFATMVYFYLPIMGLMSAIGVQGEFGPFLAGMFFGWFIYGALFGMIMVAIGRLR